MLNESVSNVLPLVAVAGGSGKLGAALARRLSRAGYRVIVGSRDAAKAREAAASLGNGCEGDTNAAAATRADIVILAVPYGSRSEILEQIRDGVSGKIVVDTTVPLRPPNVSRVHLTESGSAAVETQKALGPTVRVVAAFHNVAAHKLATDEDVDCDVLVFGDDKSARVAVIELVRACKLRGLHGGVLANSVTAESLTSVLILINRLYRVDGAGIRITGTLLDPDEASGSDAGAARKV